ncbi:hypothetical protein Tco_1398530, partial [Tanacetum coccineum]
EDASKQGRIFDIDADENMTLVNVYDDAEMFDVNDLGGEEVFVKEVNVAQVNTAATNATISTKEITLAQALEALKTSKPKEKGKKTYKRERAEKEQEANIALIETWDDIQAKIDADHQLAERLKIICNYLKNMEGYKLKDLKLKEFDFIQEMFDKAFRRVNTFEDFRTELVEGKEKRVGEEMIQEITKKQKVDDDKETTKLKQFIEVIPDEEVVAIDAIPLAVKSPKIVDWKIYKERKKSYYQIIRAGGKSQMYIIMFEPHVEDEVWNKQQGYKVLSWKLYDSCGVHSLRMQCADLYVGCEEISPYTIYTYNDVGKEA